MSRGQGIVLGFVIAVVYVLLGTVLNIWWYYHRPSLSYSVIFVGNLVPGIAFLLAAVLVGRYQASIRTCVSILVTTAFSGLSLLIVVNSVAARDHHFYVQRQLKNYAFYLEQASKIWPAFFSHFPSEVPEQCVHASFFRGRLLDLTLLQLRLKLDAESVKTVAGEYVPRAIHAQNGYDIHSLAHVPYLVTRFRNKDNTGFATLPHHFNLVVLRVGIDGLGNPAAWQTDYSCGVAFSTQTNEVIYWATHPG